MVLEPFGFPQVLKLEIQVFCEESFSLQPRTLCLPVTMNDVTSIVLEIPGAHQYQIPEANPHALLQLAPNASKTFLSISTSNTHPFVSKNLYYYTKDLVVFPPWNPRPVNLYVATGGALFARLLGFLCHENL